MGVYKDDKTASWFCKFYFKDWQGDRHQTTKRGFKTKRDALRWQADFIAKENRSMHISFEAYVKIYFEDKKNKLKERTVYNKKYMIDKHILPYFKNKKVDEVTSSDIIQWQNAMEEKGYSQTYLRMVQNQLTALYTHAAKIYGLKNPCVSVEKMGKSDADHIDFWTKEEYDRFISVVDKSDKYYVLFELLFWTGIRIGDDDDKIRLNQRKPSKYKGLRRFGPEKNLQRINKFMKERPIFYKNLIYLRCFYCITKVMILQFNSENRTELARNG
ncbi:MAG: Arm DNA-binding domain-containing protein [Coprococcus sp.]|nr:Arm DNA-binding domain-containing protein [Coprococcus sp.]